MNILICLDDYNGNFTRHYATALLSLFEHNKNNKMNVYLMSSVISEENKNELKRICDEYGNNIYFYIDENIIPKEIKSKLIHKRTDLPYVTFYRLFCNLYIKDNIDRLLYIDADILIRKDINDIYFQDLEGNALAGGHDVGWMRYLKKKELGLNNYINSGVLLIDFMKFKEVNIEKEIDNVNKIYGSNLNSSDQDYINIIFNNKIKINDYRINCIINKKFLTKYKNAYICHLVNKPFLKFSRVPKELIKEYNFYLDKTKWKNFSENTHDNNIIGFLLNINGYITDILIYVFGIFLGDRGQYLGVQLGNIHFFIYNKIKKSLKFNYKN